MPDGLAFVLRHIRHLAGSGADSTDDAFLVATFASQRDEAAFAALVGRHGPMVLGVCRRLLRHDADAEDAFQAVFMVLARKAASLTGHRSVAGWLHEVAVRIALKARTARDRRRIHERRAAAMTETSAAPGDVDDLGPILDEELARLPEKYRLPLVLCDLQGHTHGRAAAEVGCPVGSVSWRLARGRELLRLRLTQRGVTITGATLAALLAERTAPPIAAATMKATVTAALAFAAGEATLRPAVSTLAEEVLKGLSLTKARVLALVALALTTLALGGGLLGGQPRGQGQPVGQTPTPAVAGPPTAGKPRTNLQDPLPPGALARLGTLRWRVGEDVHLLEYSPDQAVLAVAGQGGLTLWDTATGHPLSRPVEQKEHVHAVAFAPDSKKLALTMGDFPGGKGGNRAPNRPVRLVAVPSGKEIRHFNLGNVWVAALAFSPDGKLMALGDAGGQVVVCDSAEGRIRGRCAVPGQPVARLAFSADSRRLAVAHSNALRVWDIRAAADSSAIRLTESARPQAATFQGPLALGFRAKDGALVAVDGDGHCRSWDAASGRMLAQLHDRNEGYFDVRAAALSRDGTRIALSGSYVESWPAVFETETGRPITRGPTQDYHPRCLQLTPDGRSLVALQGGVLRFWDVRTGREDVRAEGHAGHLWSVALSADGRTAVTAGSDNSAAVWDAATGWRRYVLDHRYDPYAVALAPDGQTFVSGGSDGWVRFWDITTGKKRFEASDGACVYRVTYSPDGQLVACGSLVGATLIDAATGRVLRRLLPEDRPSYSHLVFSTDGRTLATATGYKGPSSDARIVDLWDVAKGERLRRFEAPSIVRLVSLSPDGTRLLADCDSGSVTWDVRTGARLRTTGAGARLLPFALSADGRTLAGSDGSDVVLVERSTGKRRRTFRGHSGGVGTMAFSRDGRRLLSGAGDTTALVWDVTGGRGQSPNLSARDLAARWEALAADDAGRAFDALWDLVGARGTVAFLRERLRPVPQPDAGHLSRLIAGLDSDRYEEREAATKELRQLGELAKPALAALIGGQPAPEARSRAEGLLRRLRQPGAELLTGAALRQLRAIEVLEAVGTVAARDLLRVLAQGAPEAALTHEAREALGRLENLGR